MDITAIIKEFFNTPAGQATLAVALLATADFAFGVFAAVRDNVFKWEALAAWVRSTLMGKVAPVFAALIVGHLAGGLTLDDGLASLVSPGAIITGVGLAAATSYVLSVVASIRESFIVKTDTREVPED